MCQMRDVFLKKYLCASHVLDIIIMSWIFITAVMQNRAFQEPPFTQLSKCIDYETYFTYEPGKSWIHHSVSSTAMHFHFECTQVKLELSDAIVATAKNKKAGLSFLSGLACLVKLGQCVCHHRLAFKLDYCWNAAALQA